MQMHNGWTHVCVGTVSDNVLTELAHAHKTSTAMERASGMQCIIAINIAMYRW